MKQVIGVLVVAAVAALFLLLSRVRKKRIQPTLDAFAKAYCELIEHVLGGIDPVGHAALEPEGSGRFRLRPPQEQPERIRALLGAGVDAYAHAHVKTMFDLREEAQAHLSTVNFIGGKINGVLNRVYDLTNLSLSVLNAPDTLLSEAACKDLDFFLNQQAYIRSTTLAAIVSDDGYRGESAA